MHQAALNMQLIELLLLHVSLASKGQ